MAPHAVTNGDSSQDKQRAVRVLVTGFGPFQERYPINPSFEITRSLPETLQTLTCDGREVQIIGYGAPIRVCYEEVRELVPLLHENYLGSVDLILHIGMASGRQHYTAELYAHRDGYTKNKDLDGKTLPPDDGAKQFPDCPIMMTTSLDFSDVLSKWRTKIKDLPKSSAAYGADCRPSEDAGRYLCDFIYYNSLAWFGRRNSRLDGGKVTDRPVLFLHVPAESDPKMLQKGTQVALALIEAMVDNWCSAKTNGYLSLGERLPN
jgi:pyrrolidone-carboxylate peptidase